MEPGCCSVVYILLLLVVCTDRENLSVGGAFAPPPVLVLADDGVDGGADGGFWLSASGLFFNFLFSGCLGGDVPPDSGPRAG